MTRHFDDDLPVRNDTSISFADFQNVLLAVQRCVRQSGPCTLGVVRRFLLQARLYNFETAMLEKIIAKGASIGALRFAGGNVAISMPLSLLDGG